jgi:hypothetical protein
MEDRNTIMQKEGHKDDSGKIPLDLIDPTALIELAKVLQFGANKYAAHNWRKGFKITRLISALMRHILAFNDGEDNDPETGLSHIAHAMCNCMFIIKQQIVKPELDDRYKPPLESSFRVTGGKGGSTVISGSTPETHPYKLFHLRPDGTLDTSKILMNSSHPDAKMHTDGKEKKDFDLRVIVLKKLEFYGVRLTCNPCEMVDEIISTIRRFDNF